VDENKPKTIILAVDDDETLLDMYRERLEQSGYQVVTATGGKEAIAKAEEYMPNCILLDILMPTVSGYDVLSAVRSNEKTKNIPVIMLTALVQDTHKQKSLSEGADEYLIKSEIMPGEVIAKIEDVIKAKKGK